MINIFYKTIHNKYYRFFRFIFFLRYLIGIFFIAIVLFLTIPNFFNYEKRAKIIQNYLAENYNYEIKKYEKIEFQPLPIPKLELKNAEVNLKLPSITLKVQKLKLYPNILSIYNYENFQLNKVQFENNKVSLDVSDLKFLIKNFYNQKNKLSLDNLDIEINDKNNPIVKLEKITFSNFGYNKNLFEGHIFGKKFKSKISNTFQSINLKITNSGINAEIDFDDKIKDNSISGVFKSKILNSNLKFNFNYDDRKLNIYDSFFRNKNLSFNNKSTVVINPFFDIKSKFDIEDINPKILKKINLKKLLESKNILNKITTKTEISFKSKKFNRNLIDKFNLKIDLAYGRMNYLKSFSISDSFFKCKGNLNFLDDYPLLFFDCSIFSEDKNKLLKEFSIKSKFKKDVFKINVTGNLNILNKKINLKNVSMNENYNASVEDLEYFMDVFENIVFNESFEEIFSLKKIKDFILEIS